MAKTKEEAMAEARGYGLSDAQVNMFGRLFDIEKPSEQDYPEWAAGTLGALGAKQGVRGTGGGGQGAAQG